MRPYLRFFISTLFPTLLCGTPAMSQIIWQIGKNDESTRELALGPSDYRALKQDGFYLVGTSDPSRDWPYVHPGPNDSWAGSRNHTYTVLFNLGQAPRTGSYVLKLALTDTHGSIPPEIEIRMNSFIHKAKLPVGGGDASVNGDYGKGKPLVIELPIPEGIIQKGINHLTVESLSGSWFLYDALSLEGPAGAKSEPIRNYLDITRAEAGNALTGQEGHYSRELFLTVVYSGKPLEANICVNSEPVLPVTLVSGRNEITVTIPEVSREGSVSVGIMSKGKIQKASVVPIRPVRKLMVYILPHSHTDIGYTEIQTAIEEKQVKNLVEGIGYAERTASYPEGAKFVWNVEVAWAADLYLNRLGPEAREKLLKAMRQGQVAMNGMYLNELTGLCRPEELLRLFKYSVELGQITGQKVDAAMISDVPGYTWGTVTAMAQAGIRYFSVAPNFFDRIGDILVQWENRPFYWEGPSGTEKVLVWIPLKGYAMSHIVGKLSRSWVTDYTAQLEKMNYPYDIAHIRWSGHGDNAVPDPAICEFVKDWNSKYSWPRFKISSTSEAFSAFEGRYGSALPTVRGDWTPYWEDGAGSSALETAMNRNTADRLSQAQTLWALQSPGTYPVERFEEAWKKVLLYSEHTWGAWCSITDPENKMTVEQWEIKKSYADDAAAQTAELLSQATNLGPSAPEGQTVEIVNTSNWVREEMVFLSPEQSKTGDLVRTSNGQILPSQRLTTGELAVGGISVNPYGSLTIRVEKGHSDAKGSVSVKGTTISNQWIECEIHPENGDIIRLIDKRNGKNLAENGATGGLNRYLYFEGNDLSGLVTNGPATIKVHENGPLVAHLEIISSAPGTHSLSRSLWLTDGADYLVIANTVDKKRAPMPENIGDWYLAQNKNKESVNFGFPFSVPGGNMRLDLPLGQMIPWKDQIPSACKNWYTTGRWADVSNSEYGITWVTLDAPLLQVGELSARLIGSQSNPEVWRKSVEPTQTLYSWAMNNHWGTNYRQYQEGPVTFRYVLRPHQGHDAVQATRFSTGFSQPLIIRNPGAPINQPFTLESNQLVVIACKPADDGKGTVVTLFNPSLEPGTYILKNLGERPLFRCDTGENPMERIAEKGTLAGQGVIMVRF